MRKLLKGSCVVIISLFFSIKIFDFDYIILNMHVSEYAC